MIPLRAAAAQNQAEFLAFISRQLTQSQTHLGQYLPDIQRVLAHKQHEPPHGDFARWLDVLQKTAHLVPTQIDFNRAAIQIGQPGDLTLLPQLALSTEEFNHLLMQLHPWRKGPFELFGSFIDTEWRSDYKWNRLLPHIQPLAGRSVLDVGCGSGYHMWRMLGEGARAVLGIEPMWQYVLQFYLMKQWLMQAIAAPVPTAFLNMPPRLNIDSLPLTLEELPPLPERFDSIFSMGVLYHRRDPLQHLMTLKTMLRDHGELILETLVVEGDAQTVLMPPDRYCRMRNVWFLPSVAQLIRWCERLGFKQVRAVDITQTMPDEQRKTDWMTYDSLQDSLDSSRPHLTVEGLPAPLRVIVLARR